MLVLTTCMPGPWASYPWSSCWKFVRTVAAFCVSSVVLHNIHKTQVFESGEFEFGRGGCFSAWASPPGRWLPSVQTYSDCEDDFGSFLLPEWSSSPKFGTRSKSTLASWLTSLFLMWIQTKHFVWTIVDHTRRAFLAPC